MPNEKPDHESGAGRATKPAGATGPQEPLARAEGELHPYAYHVVRYVPNLLRDEWVNIGILLFDPANGRILRRLMEEPGEFAHVRRLDPDADEDLLRHLSEELEAQLAAGMSPQVAPVSEGDNALRNLSRLEQTLSNSVQFSAQKGLLAADLDAELDRLYRDHVEPPRYERLFYDLPAGTEVSVRTEATIDLCEVVEGQTFTGEVAMDVRDANEAVVIPRGANADIVITSGSRGNRLTGASDLELDLKTVSIDGRRYRLSTASVERQGKSGLGANKRTAEYTVGAAALGAIIGAIAAGSKGAGIGAGAGAGAGALTQILSKGKTIRVPVETILTFKLDKPLHVSAAR